MLAVSNRCRVHQGPRAMAANSASELNGSTVAARKLARKSAGKPASAQPVKSSIRREDAHCGTGSAYRPSKRSTMRNHILLLAAVITAASATAQRNGYDGDLGGHIGLGSP